MEPWAHTWGLGGAGCDHSWEQGGVKNTTRGGGVSTPLGARVHTWGQGWGGEHTPRGRGWGDEYTPGSRGWGMSSGLGAGVGGKNSQGCRVWVTRLQKRYCSGTG